MLVKIVEVLVLSSQLCGEGALTCPTKGPYINFTCDRSTFSLSSNSQAMFLVLAYFTSLSGHPSPKFVTRHGDSSPIPAPRGPLTLADLVS